MNFKEKKQEELEAKKAQDIDFLAPYLARMGDVKYLSNKHAQQLRDDCVRDFKEVMVNRANGILLEIEKEKAELDKLQDLLTNVCIYETCLIFHAQFESFNKISFNRRLGQRTISALLYQGCILIFELFTNDLNPDLGPHTSVENRPDFILDINADF